MRTTLSIDDDVLAAAKGLAARQNKTVGEVVSALARILTTDYTGNSTVITLMYKNEPGIVAESLSTTQVSALEANNANVFVNYNNATAILQRGVCASGVFMDTVVGTDWLAVAGGTPGKQGELWLAHGQNQQPARRLLSTSDTVNAVAASPDGRWLAAAGTDRHTRLYSLPEGKLKWDVEANSDWVLTLDFSPDGKLLASGSRDRTARLFDVQTGQVTATHDGHEAAVTSVCFFDKGRQVVSADAEGYLRRWTLEGRADKSTATRPGRQAVLALLSSQERTFVAFADKGLAEQDVKGKKVKRSFGKATRMNAVASFSQPPSVTAEGKKGEPELMLVSGSHAGLLQVWRVADSSLAKEWPLVQR